MIFKKINNKESTLITMIFLVLNLVMNRKKIFKNISIKILILKSMMKIIEKKNIKPERQISGENRFKLIT